jgi:probable phosphoglycerate mutase
VLEDLREMSYGTWEGRSFLDVRRENEELYQQWILDGATRCPEGESHDDVRQRMTRAFAHIEAQGDERALVVAHGTANRIGATALMNLPVMASRHFAADNASLNVFVWRLDRWVLRRWNDTSHCAEL